MDRHFWLDDTIFQKENLNCTFLTLCLEVYMPGHVLRDFSSWVWSGAFPRGYEQASNPPRCGTKEKTNKEFYKGNHPSWWTNKFTEIPYKSVDGSLKHWPQHGGPLMETVYLKLPEQLAGSWIGQVGLSPPLSNLYYLYNLEEELC